MSGREALAFNKHIFRIGWCALGVKQPEKKLACRPQVNNEVKLVCRTPHCAAQMRRISSPPSVTLLLYIHLFQLHFMLMVLSYRTLCAPRGRGRRERIYCNESTHKFMLSFLLRSSGESVSDANEMSLQRRRRRRRRLRSRPIDGQIYGNNRVERGVFAHATMQHVLFLYT